MRYRAYITDICENEAANHHLLPEVQRLAEKIEMTQSLAGWERFPYPYTKKRLGKFRVIAETRRMGDDLIICLLGYLPRSSREYEKRFLDDRERDQFCSPRSPSDAELSRFLAAQTEHVIPELQQLNDVETSYLFAMGQVDKGTGGDVPADETIYESRDWVQAVAELDAHRWIARYYDLLGQIVGDGISERTELWMDGGSVGILFKYLPDERSVFLVAPLHSGTDAQELEKLRKRYADILDPGPEVLGTERIIRNSGRSYPAFILADEETWGDIQDSVEGNLSLSPEETAILNSIVRREQSDRAYPLFINGRPGSGKSTILQYLFAEHLYAHLRNNPAERLEFPPLYLTYGERLLHAARESVKTILSCNSEKIIEKRVNFAQDDVMAVFDSSFGEFHKFLLELLPSEQRESFDPARRIDFPAFRRLWQDFKKGSRDLRRFSPELVWHVIRTYIKGMADDVDSYLDPDAYLELPTKRKTVEQETFALIHDRVWENWYKGVCRDEGKWDNQDLTRAVLNLDDLNLSRYPAVFCDEAQDFTTIELELILRLSLFSKRAVQPHCLHLVPFAFAGDPFQTLNPTGFDWDAVQAGFHEQIVQALDKDSRANLQFNYHELGYNYRSTRNIVRFCNLLQLLRGILFDVMNLTPQQTWFDDDDSPMPVFFGVEDLACQKNLDEQSELVIILPCQEGEEYQYVAADPVLSQIAQADSEVRNFLSPMSAKGLEFSRVVLYKFGEEFCSSFPELLKPIETGVPHTQDREGALRYEYYLNRLYVASSRAKKRLIIVDTQQAIAALWESDQLSNFDTLLKRYSEIARHEWSADDLSFVRMGLEESWYEDRDDPETLAVLLREAGKDDKDPYKLRLAAGNFRRASGSSARFEKDALECDALRLQIEGTLREAGDVYLKLNKKKESLMCYWRSQSYREIWKHTEFAGTPEHRAADFLIHDTNSAAGHERFIDFLYEQIQGPDRTRIVADEQWGTICASFIWSIVEIEQDRTPQWARIYSQLIEIRNAGIEFAGLQDLAELAFRAGHYEDALNMWDATGSFTANDKRYQQAKAQTTEYPERLMWLAKTEADEDIMALWNENRHRKLPSEYVAYVSSAFQNRRRYQEAIDFLRTHPHEKEIERLLSAVTDSGDSDLILAVALESLRQMTVRSKWKDAIHFVKNTKYPNEIARNLQARVVRDVAASDRLPAESARVKRDVSDFLRDLFIDSPWSNIVDVQVAGAAIEKADKIVDSLEFYESVWKNQRVPTNDAGVRFAQERWIKRKLRMAEHSKKARADEGRHRMEALRYAKEWGIDPDTLPDYPQWEPIEEIDPSPSGVGADQRRMIRTLLDSGEPMEKITSAFDLDIADVESIRDADTDA